MRRIKSQFFCLVVSEGQINQTSTRRVMQSAFVQKSEFFVQKETNHEIIVFTYKHR